MCVSRNAVIRREGGYGGRLAAAGPAISGVLRSGRWFAVCGVFPKFLAHQSII
jgi:hypothetical protein